MTSVKLQGLVKRFGSTVAVDKVELEIAPGELFSLLGSSGCGKTTTLRCVAGLEIPSAGKILFADNDVTNLPPYYRDCGMVFQNYALFPHMTVLDNVAYGLMAKRFRQANLIGKATILISTVWSSIPEPERNRVMEALDMVELADMATRKPAQLSGGQQQRVALARALVTKPKVLLFDEPLGALDAKLRVKMREEIRRIQKNAGITTLYVTHDQEEALAISDRIAVMNQGKVVQMGTPEELYRSPRTKFIADFIGLTNIYRARATGENTILLLESSPPLELICKTKLPPPGTEIYAAVRPEGINMHPTQATNQLTAQVNMKMFMGATTKYTFSLNGLQLTASIPQSISRDDIQVGDEIALGISPDDVLILEN